MKNNRDIGISTFPFATMHSAASHVFATEASNNSLRIMNPHFFSFFVFSRSLPLSPSAEALFSSVILQAKYANARMYVTQPQNGKGVGIFITNQSATICKHAERYQHTRIAAGIRTFVLFRRCFNLATAVKEFRNFYRATFSRQK